MECSCGSGKPREALSDARGIFVAYVCDDCKKRVMSKYRRDVFTNPRYPVDEPIDEEE